ncbi:MAG: hypothetical protein EVB11_08955 [Winogradskyella sp.]|nr:MAG: hypothetical protein EVB11_08955 [Winogradskyella sp.]
MPEAASTLYDTLYKVDKEGLDIIITKHFLNKDIGKSINDRLERATK